MVTRGPGMAACSSNSMASAAARASADTAFGQFSTFVAAVAALSQRGPCLVQLAAPARPASPNWTDGPAPSNVTTTSGQPSPPAD
eukprot:9202338-Alexandrium_andersonii.AAC.1